MSTPDASIPSDDDALAGGEFSDEIDGATRSADDTVGATDGADADLGDGTDGGDDDGIRLDPDDAPLGDTTVGGTAAADAEFEGRPVGDATTGDDSATTADAGFGDTAPDGFSSDTEETYAASDIQPESQGQDPVIIELGEEGEGDLAPEDI